MSAAPPSPTWQRLLESAADEQVIFRIGPATVPEPREWRSGVRKALESPIGSRPLGELAEPGARTVILADDGTRPTPQHRLLPPLLECLNDAGVTDEEITVLVALGTHRYMSRAEMRERFGTTICERVNVYNHTWRDESCLETVGATESGSPLRLNRLALRADLLIGTGSIVPHIWAGWGGGAKILLPGISAAETIAPTHALAEQDGDLTAVVGRAENACRVEIERAAGRAGMDLILNCVTDAAGRPAWIGAGHPVQAHRAGVEAAEKVFRRPIPEPADIVLADARPAVKDYWQGIKALAHAARAARMGGTIVLTAAFLDGVAPTHPEFLRHARRSPDEILKLAEKGCISDPVIVTTLRLHAMLREKCHVICLSGGIHPEEAEALGFEHADSPEDALRLAGDLAGDTDPAVGIVEYAGDVLPA